VALRFENVGSTTCSLFGYPGVAAMTSSGIESNAMRTPSGYLGGLWGVSSGPIPGVVLPPGTVASALVEGTDMPINAQPCPDYVAELVTAPDTTSSVGLSVALPGCTTLQVHPVVPGKDGIEQPTG
jgi:hypothetical protein